MKTDKPSANKRMSLDPSKNTNLQIIQKNHSSEVQVRNSAPQESLASIYNHHQEQYTIEDLQRIFNAIAQGKDRITVQDLYMILNEEGYSDNLYSAVDMISLVDEGRKGYLNKKQFMDYFSSKTYVDQQKVPALTPEMVQNEKWVRAIEENWQFFKDFQDKQYCLWVAQKIKQCNKNNKLF